MQYLLLIYGAENHWETLTEAERQNVIQQFIIFRQDLLNSGKYVGGNPLQPVSTARTVRIRSGRKLVTDGPFAETKEQLGGYFLVEAKNLDEAQAIAARIPSVSWGSIEVRPVVTR